VGTYRLRRRVQCFDRPSRPLHLLFVTTLAMRLERDRPHELAGVFNHVAARALQRLGLAHLWSGEMEPVIETDRGGVDAHAGQRAELGVRGEAMDDALDRRRGTRVLQGAVTVDAFPVADR